MSLCTRIFQKLHVQVSRYFLYMLPVGFSLFLSDIMQNMLCISSFVDDVMFLRTIIRLEKATRVGYMLKVTQ